MNSDANLPRSFVLLRILFQGRHLILGGTAISVIVAAVAAFVLPQTFESSASLLLLPPPFKQATDISSFMPKILSVPDYRILLTSDGVLSQAANKIKAQNKWPEKYLSSLNEISNLRKAMSAEIEITEKTVNGVSYSPVIVLKARADTPECALDLAQAWSDVAQELTASLYQKGKTGMKDFMSGRFDNSKTELIGVHQDLLKIELEWNDELEHARLFKKHERLLLYEEKLIDLRTQIATASKELEDLQNRLSNEPEFKTLWKSPPMESVFLEESQSAGKGKDHKAPKGYQEEILNQTYIYLKEKVVLKESELAGMHEYESQMVAAMDQLEKEVTTLREESARRGFERKNLELQIAPYKSNFDLLASKLEQVKIAEAEQANITDIKLIGEPVLPDRKIRPLRSLIIAMGAFVGLAASSGAVYLRAMIKVIS